MVQWMTREGTDPNPTPTPNPDRNPNPNSNPNPDPYIGSAIIGLLNNHAELIDDNCDDQVQHEVRPEG